MDGDETLARELLTSTRDGVAIFGPSGRLVMWNSAAETITGWTKADAATRDLSTMPTGRSELREGMWIDARRIRFHLGDDLHHAVLFAESTPQLPPTGFPGRASALEHLGRSLALAERDRRVVGVLSIACRPPRGSGPDDIDDGSLAGEIARRLAISTRSSDFVAHTGTLSFVVVLTAMSGAADSVMVVTARLLLALAQPVAAGGLERSITTAIGITRGPAAGVSAADLLECAEDAMRAARAGGAPYRLVAAHARERDPEVVVGQDLLV